MHTPRTVTDTLNEPSSVTRGLRTHHRKTTTFILDLNIIKDNHISPVNEGQFY